MNNNVEKLGKNIDKTEEETKSENQKQPIDELLEEVDKKIKELEENK